ncbi:hypothetical protein JCM10908_004869 [Rhodotorula pacifica]|uniref:uncharacterized protein n=1 Tax=Rhodotorula pacifica TaxID=1495444 RepID=UPI0031821F69
MSPPKTETDLEQVPTRVAFSGHLGHLTPAQDQALQDFKARLEENGYYTPASKSEGGLASADDVTLVRFLRARKFDIQGAYAQFTSAEDWRRSEQIDVLYDTFSLAEFEMARQLYPQWTGRRDNSGLPVYVFEVGSLTKDKTDPYSKDGSRLEPRIVALYEHMVQFVLPLCSAIPHAHQESPISGCATLVDISGVSLQRFWALKGHMQRASTLANARYAETLGAIYLIGAPSFFSVVWGWIQKWFDEGTRNKIHILSASDLTSTLSAHMPPSSIPREYGGTLDWTFGESGPNLDPEARDLLHMQEGEEMPKGPLRWEREGGGVRVVGGEGRSEEEKQRWNNRGKEKAQEQEQQRRPEDAVSEVVTRSSEAPAGVEVTAPLSSSAEAPAPATLPPQPTTIATPSPAASLSSPAPLPAAQSNDLPPPILGQGYSNADPSSPSPATASSASATAAEPSSLANGSARNGGKEREEEEQEHDIHIAARENAGAPIKDLAAALEGTTL